MYNLINLFSTCGYKEKTFEAENTANHITYNKIATAKLIADLCPECRNVRPSAPVFTNRRKPIEYNEVKAIIRWPFVSELEGKKIKTSAKRDSANVMLIWPKIPQKELSSHDSVIAWLSESSSSDEIEKKQCYPNSNQAYQPFQTINVGRMLPLRPFTPSPLKAYAEKR